MDVYNARLCGQFLNMQGWKDAQKDEGMCEGVHVVLSMSREHRRHVDPPSSPL